MTDLVKSASDIVLRTIFRIRYTDSEGDTRLRYTQLVAYSLSTLERGTTASVVTSITVTAFPCLYRETFVITFASTKCDFTETKQE